MTISFTTPDPNPFTPDFGQSPALLIGRDGLLARIGTSLSSGPRHPGFTTLLLGPAVPARRLFSTARRMRRSSTVGS